MKFFQATIQSSTWRDYLAIVSIRMRFQYVVVNAQSDFRWAFRRVDKSFRGASEAQIECSECHFPMGRPLGDGSFPWINLTDAWNFRLLLSIGSWLTTYRLRHRAVETSFLGKKFVIHKSAISSPRHPSEIYSEQDESEIRTCVLTITKLRSTCWSKYILIF